MPDISMCTNRTCPKRSDCYRYRVVPNDHRQSYGSFTHTEAEPCSQFSKVREGDPLVPTQQVDRRLAEWGQSGV
jgi:hypothetical protein